MTGPSTHIILRVFPSADFLQREGDFLGFKVSTY